MLPLVAGWLRCHHLQLVPGRGRGGLPDITQYTILFPLLHRLDVLSGSHYISSAPSSNITPGSPFIVARLGTLHLHSLYIIFSRSTGVQANFDFISLEVDTLIRITKI